MARFVIHGGKRLSGRHTVPGNKNAALPMLAACLLTDQTLQLHNVPLIEDVRVMLDILDHLGVSVQLHGRTVRLRAMGIRRHRVPSELCRKVRSSILFAGPLVARVGKAVLFPPGGDVIGRRRLDPHFDGLRQLGVRIDTAEQYVFERGMFCGADILLEEASVTATENVLMASVLAPGRTTIFNAACEPHVQDLCRLLNAMGARISGIGTNLLTIEGVPALHGTAHTIAPDYVDAVSFIAASALTNGELLVEPVELQPMTVVARQLRKLGLCWRISENALRLPARQCLRVRNDFGEAIPKIEDGPWPAFPSDLMSVAIVLATQADGTMLFFEKMFESRMFFVDRMIAMGARIILCDPHRVIVNGPAKLHGTHLSSPDIRAGMALLLAALCARGTSIISNAESIDRGYEQVDQRLRMLGADIERIR
ncbi:MAG: UDP-N-acetylglucosamine 1-carboxyvinyltransferase [Kiritimatiellae bacterium]|nr:UDP-N-acetylglucosamine 1-carboxyvinyltransferase [Kiritimatiellia bacterium]